MPSAPVTIAAELRRPMSHSTEVQAQDVISVIDAVGEAVHLVGHSGGARVTLTAALHTDRLRSLVLYEPPIALQHCRADLADHAEALIRDGDRDAAAEIFLREAAAVPDEEIAIVRSLPEVWEGITAGVHNGPRDHRTARLWRNPSISTPSEESLSPFCFSSGASRTHPSTSTVWTSSSKRYPALRERKSRASAISLRAERRRHSRRSSSRSSRT
jgi:pimeloyl-ACP methyl ester carboxylesterase